MVNPESNSNPETPKRSNFRIANFVNNHKSDGMDFKSQIQDFQYFKNKDKLFVDLKAKHDASQGRK